MIIHIYSLIYILLLYMLIERIIDLCFSLDCALGTQKTGPSRVTCWSLKSCQSCRSPDCHYRRVVSFHQETDECGDKYLLTFHSPSSLPKGDYIVHFWLPLNVLWETWLWSYFSLREGGERSYSKNKDRNSSFNLHRDIKNKHKCISIGRGEKEGLQTRKK